MAFNWERTGRYQVLRATERLSGKLLLFVFLLLVLALVLEAFLWSDIGLFVFTASLLAATFHVFLFAKTYPSLVNPQKTVDDLLTAGDGNVLRAASDAAVLLLGKNTKAVDEPSLVQVTVRNILDSDEVISLSQALEINLDDVWSIAQQLVVPEATAEALAAQWLAVAQKTSSELEVVHLFAGLLLLPQLKNWLRQQGLVEKDIEFVAWWRVTKDKAEQRRQRWWSRENMLDFSGVGLSWTSGYTPLVDQLARFPAGNLWDQFISGREQQFDELVATLSRTEQSNVLLVGQPGVGRLGLVKELSRRVLAQQAHPELNGKRVMYIHMADLLSSSGGNESQLSVIAAALREMEAAGNVIAVIDGLSSVLGQSVENRLNLTDVLQPFFAASTVRVVVIMSNDDYHLRIKSNEELLHYFEVVEIPSATPETTLQALMLMSDIVEKRTGVFLPYRTLRTVVDKTHGLLQHIPYPERAFDVLEEALVIARAEKVEILSSDIVTDLISRKVGVPVGKLTEEERVHLLNLEEMMHQRVVNQRIAIKAVARAMIRARAGVRTSTKPIGNFLFLGPTGVGKTETAKTLAQAYFGHEDYMLRFDMSEFSDAAAVDKLIGSAAQPVGRLTSAINDHPFTVLLLDEFEKASRPVQQMFLQVFDEGHLTDAAGRQVSFDHAIIIATSNAGAELIRQKVEAGEKDFEAELREHILQENIFRPELLNRFDGVITFTPLTPEHVEQVAQLMLFKLNKRLDYEHGITVAVTQELLDYLVSVGYNPEFGARPMARAIADKVEYEVAQQLLRGMVKPGQQITLTPAQLAAAS